MHREDVKAGLRKRGTSLAEIADKLGVSRQAPSAVLKGLRSRRVEKAIADGLGLPVEEVFPERYELDQLRAERKRLREEYKQKLKELNEVKL